MGTCEMCGYEGELVDAVVEGSMLNVCRKCSRYGHVVAVEKPRFAEQKQRKIVVEEVSKYVMDNCGKLVKQARERKGWTQEDLARQIRERESIISHVESDHLKPSLDLATKLERALGIVLILMYEEPREKPLNLRDESLTIGDLVQLKEKRS